MLIKNLGFITLIDKLAEVIANGISIKTSGSSGTPKEIFQKPSKIVADAKNAIEVQNINESSTIYTCLSLERAGGLFAQSIPGLLANATIDFDTFDPYTYVKVAYKYTHTHLTPKQAKGVMLTKGFKTLDLTGSTFMIGSEPVMYDIIEAFIQRGAKVILIWGMTEVGPNAIMHIFNNIEEVQELKDITPPNSTPLGNIFNCEYMIDEENRLLVKGDISVFGNNWFNTKDQVIEKDGILFYTGRDGNAVDFNAPRKG